MLELVVIGQLLSWGHVPDREDADAHLACQRQLVSMHAGCGRVETLQQRLTAANAHLACSLSQSVNAPGHGNAR